MDTSQLAYEPPTLTTLGTFADRVAGNYSKENSDDSAAGQYTPRATDA